MLAQCGRIRRSSSWRSARPPWPASRGGPSWASPGRPPRARARWPASCWPSWRRTPRSSRWTAFTWPTMCWRNSARCTARARRTPSTRPAMWRCCAGCGIPPRAPCTRRSSAARSRTRLRTRSACRRTCGWSLPKATTCWSGPAGGPGCAGLLDEVWYLDPDEPARLRWLTDRHVRYGRSAAEAAARATGPDQRNAELIEATKPRADLTISVTPAGYSVSAARSVS